MTNNSSPPFEAQVAVGTNLYTWSTLFVWMAMAVGSFAVATSLIGCCAGGRTRAGKPGLLKFYALLLLILIAGTSVIMRSAW